MSDHVPEDHEPETSSKLTRIRVWGIVVLPGLVIVPAIAILLWAWHPTGANSPTEWLGIATGALALETMALAIATVLTAQESARMVGIAEKDLQSGRRLVTATRRQSKLSEQALSESRRPILIPCLDKPITNPRQVSFVHDGQRSKEVQDFPFVLCFSDDNSDWVVLKIRNVGGGPAIVGKTGGDVVLQREGFDGNNGNISSRVIAPGDEVPLTFRLSKTTQPPRFWVTIKYSDLSYERQYRGNISFDEGRPQPLLVNATIEDLNVETDDAEEQST